MSTNDGGPAFPTPRYERGEMYSLGMTLRDYFAAKAMQAIASTEEGLRADPLHAATCAYCIADAMLEARSKE